jgi:tripartite-type tricarboxylate transporter receptor subunit TctC
MLRFVFFGALAGLAAAPAHAQSDDFKGKTVTIVTSTGPGGGYDLIARVISRHMPRYLPGQPNMIVQNMPGGGNVLATNHMYTVAPKDGTMIAVINNAIPLTQTIDGPGVRFDARKFNWLGSTGAKNSVTFAWHTAGITSIKQVMERELTLGGTARGSDIVIYPTVMNQLLGTKFKIVLGYKSSAEISIAMERGEVQSRSNNYSSLISDQPDWIKDKKINVLVQVGAKKDKRLPDVPLLTDLARNDEERQVLSLISAPIALGQPYLAPPEVPADRVAILRKAFAATLVDKIFIAETEKLNFEIEPLSGEEIAQVVNRTIEATPAVVAKAKEAMGPMQ